MLFQNIVIFHQLTTRYINVNYKQLKEQFKYLHSSLRHYKIYI